MTDAIAGVLILIAGVFALAAALGILRLPDVYIRMHAATKVGTLSSGLVMAAVALAVPEPGVLLRCVLIVLFLVVTAPVGAHMIGRAALTIGVKPWGIDEKDVPAIWRPDPEARRRD